MKLSEDLRGKNEPKSHTLIRAEKGGRTSQEPATTRESFVYVPTAGMRLAPEVLVLELFREIFFKSFSGPDGKERQLSPLNEALNGMEEAALYALRGRKKCLPQQRISDFFAPAYPCMAKYGWLRKQSDRVIKDFFIQGPISQYLRGTGKNSERKEAGVKEIIIKACTGHNPATQTDFTGKEIISVLTRECSLENEMSDWVTKLGEMINNSTSVFKTKRDDELATRIFDDFISICKAEERIPRMQWLQLLMSFLRFAIPVWLLSHMRITLLLRDWCLGVLDSSAIPGELELEDAIASRNRGLFHPTETPTREIFLHVEKYMKARIELNLILHLAEGVCMESKERILVTTNENAHQMAISTMLAGLHSHRRKFHAKYGSESAKQLVIREAETFSAWKNPLKKGQGKNYDEFFRILRRMAEGDDGEGYLLEPAGVKKARGQLFIVFPGPMLIKTMTFLSSQAKLKTGNANNRKLMITDIEEHFKTYGIELDAVSGARLKLIKALQKMGTLKGSPDAGESVEVISTY